MTSLLKYFFLISVLMVSGLTQAQKVDTSYLKNLYDRCLDFSDEQLDSLYYYADFIIIESQKLHFNKGDVLSFRLKGVYHDLRGEYEKAIDYYLQSLTAAQKIEGTEYELAAISDLAILYSHIKQPQKAKEMYLQFASISSNNGYIESLITSYANLGAIYNQLKLPDSALYYLKQGLDLAETFQGRMDLSTLYNNMGNAYFVKKQYSRALEYFRANYQKHQPDSTLSELWIDYLNIADSYIEMKRYDSASWYSLQALAMAKQLKSTIKESDTYSLLSKLHSRKGEYQKAYEYQRLWYALDTSLVNSETNQTIASLQERYNSQKRQRENDLLQLEVERQKLSRKVSTYLGGAAALVALIIAFFLIQKRKVNRRLKRQNELIIKQNEKLTELNNEKNSLIGIVSHDLGTPFASIKMWGQVLESEADDIKESQQKAIHRIMESASRGEDLIRNILDVEKAEINQHPLTFERLDLTILIDNIVDDFRPSAWEKGIDLNYDSPSAPLFIISDRQLLNRLCENLLSNAIKFTPSGKSVTVFLHHENENIKIVIKDEGVGIPETELPLLFSKYSKISSRPTNGEKSNGLGLSIVKRIVQELNGRIFCESEPGKGTRFTVVLKK